MNQYPLYPIISVPDWLSKLESDKEPSIYLKEEWFYIENGEIKATKLKPNHPLVAEDVQKGNCYKTYQQAQDEKNTL